MKRKLILGLLCVGSAMSVFAQGYKDGVDYYKIGQKENAKYVLEKNFNKAETDKAVVNYYMGRLALDNGNVSKAQEYFNAGVAADANQPLNYVGLGELQLKAGDAKGAEANFKIALEKDKKNAVPMIEVARAYYNVDKTKYAKQIEDMLKKADKAEKFKPEKPTPLGIANQSAIQIFNGDRFADDKDYDQACGCYDQVISLFDKNNIEASVKYAEYFYKMNPRLAINKLKETVENNPASATAKRQLAELLYSYDQISDATKLYGEYIHDPNHLPNDEVRYAELLFQSKDYVESINWCNTILKNNPNHFGIKRLKFYNQAYEKDWADAEKEAAHFFGNTGAEAKYNARDYSLYGQVLSELGKKEEAVPMYRKAAELAPEDNKIDYYKELSEACVDAKLYQEAADSYRMVVESGKGNVNDLFVLSRRYFTVAQTSTEVAEKKASYDNAVKYIADAIKQAPDNAFLYKWRAKYDTIWDATPKDGKAFDSYKILVDFLLNDGKPDNEQSQDFYEAYIYIANYYNATGNRVAAKEYFQKALNAVPSNDALRQYLNNYK